MATTYILDPSGNIIKVDEGEPKTFTVEGTALNTEDKISDISIEKAGQDIYNDIDIDINNDFASGLNNESLYDKTVQDSPNSPSFGFNSTEPNVKSSYKPLYHFSNNDSQSYNAYFASEFEMLTGFTFRDANPNSQILDATTFIIEYFSEIIVMLGIAEALSLINSQTQVEFTNNTSVAERFSLRMGDYSLQEFDIFSKYMFDVLNYPKDHSNSLSRITALYVGFASWITTDLPVDPVKIIQEAGRKGSHQIQNEYDMDIVSKNENLGLGLGFSLVHIGIAMIEATLAAVSTRSGYKRLQLLTKKFRQEKIWQQSIFSNKSFKGADEENKILVEWFIPHFWLWIFHSVPEPS